RWLSARRGHRAANAMAPAVTIAARVSTIVSSTSRTRARMPLSSLSRAGSVILVPESEVRQGRPDTTDPHRRAPARREPGAALETDVLERLAAVLEDGGVRVAIAERPGHAERGGVGD